MVGLVRRLGAAALVAAALVTPSACASTAGAVYIRSGPPRPMYEARVIAPGPAYVWVPGYYRWDGYGYRWTPGYWALPPRGRALWVPGRWERGHRGWYYVEGRWR